MINAVVNYAYNQEFAEGDLSNGSPTTLAALQLPAQTLLVADSDTGETNSLPMPNAANPADPLHHYIVSRVAYPNAPPNCWTNAATQATCGAALNNNGIGLVSQFPNPPSFYDTQARHSQGDNLGFADGHSKWVRDTSITLDYVFGSFAQ